jgi:rhodanese-related sulfurtransferase
MSQPISNPACRAAFALIALFVPATACAEEQPLCGIHSVFTSALLLGERPRFADLLKPEFVGSERGSSLTELENAASKIGLNSLSITRLTTNDLRWARYPIILHVKADLTSNQYNHFVVFGGFAGREARIFDGVNGVQTWTLAQIASRWDGNALVLSKSPIDISEVTQPSRLWLLSWTVAIAGMVGVTLLFQSRRRDASRGVAVTLRDQSLALIAIAACGTGVFHATSPDGFLRGPEAVRDVRAANASSFLPKINYEIARGLSERDEAAFVDARSVKEYDAGHIPGAFNLPPSSRDSDALRLATNVPRERRLVVYCGNSTCPFSLMSAQKLLRAGRNDIVIYSGGVERVARTKQCGGRSGATVKAVPLIPLSLALLARVGIGVVRIYSGSVKVARPHDFLTSVFQYQLLGPTSATFVAAALPFVELTAGVALLCSVFTLGAASIASALFCIFTIGQATALLRGIDADCGCFGAGEPVSGWSLLRTVVLFAAAALSVGTSLPPAIRPFPCTSPGLPESRARDAPSMNYRPARPAPAGARGRG